MNTVQMKAICEGMEAAGAPREQAIAVVLAIEHALACPDFRVQCGTFTIDSLKKFVQAAAPVAA